MAHGGAKPKSIYIQQHCNTFDLAADDLGSKTDENLSITLLLHELQNGAVPEEQPVGC